MTETTEGEGEERERERETKSIEIELHKLIATVWQIPLPSRLDEDLSLLDCVVVQMLMI